MLELIQPLLQYHETLHRQLWESILGLSDEQFVQEIPYSHGSIRNQMVHLAAVEGRWLRGLKGIARTPDVQPRPGRLLSDPPERLPVVRGGRPGWAVYAATLDEDGLLQVPAGMPGPAWQVDSARGHHGTDHRAQVLRALHDFGAPTFDQDLIFHLWARR